MILASTSLKPIPVHSATLAGLALPFPIAMMKIGIKSFRQPLTFRLNSLMLNQSTSVIPTNVAPGTMKYGMFIDPRTQASVAF